MRYVMAILIGLMFVVATVGAQTCPCNPPWLSSEIHPWPGAEHRYWHDGTVLSTSKAVANGTATFALGVQLGTLPVSVTVTTEKRVRFTMPDGSACFGVSAKGFEDPKQPITVADQFGTHTVNVNRPAYLCLGASLVLCFQAKAESPPLFPAPYPLSRVEEICATATVL